MLIKSLLYTKPMLPTKFNMHGTNRPMSPAKSSDFMTPMLLTKPSFFTEPILPTKSSFTWSQSCRRSSLLHRTNVGDKVLDLRTRIDQCCRQSLRFTRSQCCWWSPCFALRFGLKRWQKFGLLPLIDEDLTAKTTNHFGLKLTAICVQNVNN